MGCWIGLMSGTSLDGVDAVLAEDRPYAEAGLHTLQHVHLPMPALLRIELLALNSSGPDELHRAALAAQPLMRLYAQAVQGLLDASGLPPDAVLAIGAHGQTLRHQPGITPDGGYTLQLMNGALLAEITGIDVVCDFRSRDLAAGGQGAPLVPAFHAASFACPDLDVAVLNLGGIANLTLLPGQGPVSGFDCGPANVLMDLWCQAQRGSPYDTEGAWAASGHVDARLLSDLLQEPFFALSPPKSTGRDLFSLDWLQRALLHAQPTGTTLQTQDVMATLAELTAASVVDALVRHAPSTRKLLVCGGGVSNAHLMARLRFRLQAAGLQHTRVQSTVDHGIEPAQVEALAFAWLARAFVHRRPGNLPAVTGARGPRLLGSLYPAGQTS